MPSRCIVAGCSNTHRDGVSLHVFPSEPKYRQIWTKKVKQTRARWSGPSRFSVVCSAHFEPNCFDRGLYTQFGFSRASYLRKDAIPTIFAGSKGGDAQPCKPRGAFQKRERMRILNEALGGVEQTSKQDTIDDKTSDITVKDVIPRHINVCEKDNISEESLHPLQNPNQENTLHVWQNAQEECLEDETRQSVRIPLSPRPAHETALNIVCLDEVRALSENVDQCLATDKQHHGQNYESPTNKATSNVDKLEDIGDSCEKTASYSVLDNQQHGLNEELLPHKPSSNVVKLEEVPNQQQQGGSGRNEFIFLVPTMTNVIYVPQPPTNGEAIASRSDFAAQNNLKDVKIETGDQCPAHEEDQQGGREGENNVSQTFRSNLESSPSDLSSELYADSEFDNENLLKTNIDDQDNQTQGFELENIDQTSEDGRNAEMTQEEEDEEEDEAEDDNLEMEDRFSDEDYVPDVGVHLPKRKRKQRGKTLRPRRTCRKEAQSHEDEDEDEDEEDYKSESSEEDGDKEDDILSSDEDDELLSSGEDTDEMERREMLAEKRRRLKKSGHTYVRQEVRFSRLPKMYECKTCQEQIKEADDMRRHYTESHSNEQNKMPDAEQQEQSAVNVHSLSPSDMVEIATALRQCQKCKEYVSNMQEHIRSHREKKFMCETCGKRFTRKATLEIHRPVHENKEKRKRYECTECGKLHPTKLRLDDHYKDVHSGQLFICDMCGKQFNRRKSFRVHKVIHLKEKPFKCSECGRGFTQKSNMVLHMRTHTGARPYQCSVCMEAFNHNVSLKTHQKKAHGIDWWKDKNN